MGRPERRALQLSRAAAGSPRPGPSLRQPLRYGDAAPSLRGARGGAGHEDRRHVRGGGVGRRPQGGRSRPRPDGQEAALLLRESRGALLRLGDQGAPPHSWIRAPHRPGGAPPLPELQARAPSALHLRGRAHAPARPSPRLPSRRRPRHPPLLGRGFLSVGGGGGDVGRGDRRSSPRALAAWGRAPAHVGRAHRLLPERGHRLESLHRPRRRALQRADQDLHPDLCRGLDHRGQGAGQALGALGRRALPHRAPRGDHRVRRLPRAPAAHL